MVLVALILYILALLLLPATVMLIATVAILLLAVASIWSLHHLRRQFDRSPLAEIEQLEQLAEPVRVIGPDHPLNVIGGSRRG